MANNATKEGRLFTLKEILSYTGLSKKAILRLVNRHGFPANSSSGRWISHKKAIDDWWVNHSKGNPTGVSKK